MFDFLFKKNSEFLKKLPDLFYDTTIGLLRVYQDKTIELAKLRAAEMYIKGVQAARKKILAVLGVIFCVTIAASGVVAVPLTLILLSSSSRTTKLILVVVWGLVTVAIPLALTARFFSEKAWLEFSRSKELMDELVRNGRD